MSWARSLPLLSKLLTATLVVAILSLGRRVLMPIAFAAFLAFILTPPMKWLQHRITRIPALALVMLLAVGALGTAGYVLTSQLNDLTDQVGTYAESMRRKVTALQVSSARPMARVDAMLGQVTGGLEKRGDLSGAAVHVVPAQVTPAAHLWGLVTPLAEPLITVLFVLVLCIFILGQRDDLRNRLIRLIGTSNVTLTTRALDEGAQRITRYLLAQTMINAAFGTIVGAALYFIGVPYAVLWGGVAALARFIPYLGAMASMLMPAALAFAVFPGWTETILTVGLFVGLDAITAYGVEPLLIGSRTGVSSIALLISALLWVWLWGPLGLMLSTPITVSLAVLGRHVPGLQFMAVLLGDDQVIGKEISFYQRLLARDDDEAGEVAQASHAELGAAGVMDKIIIPTLVLAARDENRREITAEDETFIVAGVRDIFAHLPRAEPTAPAASPMRALGIAAHPAQSELLLEMLALQLAPEHGILEILPASTIRTEAMARVKLLAPKVVCISALPPDGGPFARELCHQLKGRFPDLTVVAFRPGEPGVDPARAARRLKEAGADLVVATVAEASAELARLLGPAPAEGQNRPATTKPAPPSSGSGIAETAPPPSNASPSMPET
jgi:predicted PurR-regulated permease PerM